MGRSVHEATLLLRSRRSVADEPSVTTRHSEAARDTVGEKLLADPAARVAAMSETGLVVPMPGSVKAQKTWNFAVL